MKKIGLLNFQHSNDNYGAVIQAAALSYIMKKKGFDVEHIDFIPESDPPPPLSTIKRIRRMFSLDVFNILKQKLNQQKQHVENSEAFENFRIKHINRTEKKYHNAKDLAEIKNDYSAVIVGSDQVWRVAYTAKFAIVYFLSFVSNQTKRIAYAASFGLHYWEKNDKLDVDIKNEITKFHAISVREKSGVQICQDEFKVEATHVLDPTLLVDKLFYDDLLVNLPPKETEEIVFYKLDVDQTFLDFLSGISDQLQLKTENIYHQTREGKKHFTEVTEWLSKIKHSNLVVTDSFHCVCFSIIFQKQFICIANESRGIERLQSLLGGLGLLDRLCFDYSPQTSQYFLENKVDYSNTNAKLQELREISHTFLNDSLVDI